MFGVSADQGDEDSGSEKRRLGVPALLRKISADRAAAGQQQEEQRGGEAAEARSGHRDKNKSRITK